MNNQKLLGIPISVQDTHAEKNRIVNQPPQQQQPPPPPKAHSGPMRLYVGSLHFNITEDMLRGIFEPFGKIDSIQLIMDSDTGRSKGYGFITVRINKQNSEIRKLFKDFQKYVLISVPPCRRCEKGT